MAALEMRSCRGCKYHKAYDDFQVKGFRLCLFFRCALVISNSSDCSYSACATERSTESPVHLLCFVRMQNKQRW